MPKAKEYCLFEVEWWNGKPRLRCHVWINRETAGLRWREHRTYSVRMDDPGKAELIKIQAVMGRQKLRPRGLMRPTIAEAFAWSKKAEHDAFRSQAATIGELKAMDEVGLPAEWAKLDGQRLRNGLAGRES